MNNTNQVIQLPHQLFVNVIQHNVFIGLFEHIEVSFIARTEPNLRQIFTEQENNYTELNERSACHGDDSSRNTERSAVLTQKTGRTKECSAVIHSDELSRTFTKFDELSRTFRNDSESHQRTNLIG